jgi:hypothetical protein
MKCTNCYGPFPAGHEHCPAAPRRVKGELKRPTQNQLKAIRRIGNREYVNQNVPISDLDNSDTPRPTEATSNTNSAQTTLGPVIVLDAEDIIMDEDNIVQTHIAREIRAIKESEPATKRRRASSQQPRATEGRDAPASSAPAALATLRKPGLLATSTSRGGGISVSQPTGTTVTRRARDSAPLSSAPTQAPRARPNYNEVNMFSNTFGQQGTPDVYESEPDEL